MGLGTSSGVVIVAFNNETDADAVMSAFESADVLGTQDARTFSVEVDANEVVNEVLECPVGLIQAVGATLTTDSASASVEYAGLPATVNDSFSCGDVIEIRLSQRQSGDAVTYALTMRVIPG